MAHGEWQIESPMGHSLYPIAQVRKFTWAVGDGRFNGREAPTASANYLIATNFHVPITDRSSLTMPLCSPDSLPSFQFGTSSEDTDKPPRGSGMLGISLQSAVNNSPIFHVNLRPCELILF